MECLSSKPGSPEITSGSGLTKALAARLEFMITAAIQIKERLEV